jgi:hypothetical protein
MKCAAVVVLVCVLVMIGCGGGSSSGTQAVTITVSPTSVALGANQTSTFTATVTNSSNSTVTWQVNGVDGGNSSVGTISTAGLYTAPGSITTQFSVTITAVSQADTTKTATAAVTLNPPVTAPKSPILISPASLTLSAGAQQTFSASVSGTTTAVTWSVSCQSITTSDCGSIDSNGVFTAPLFPPAGGSSTVTATVSDGSALPGNAPVLVQTSNQSFFGEYAFAASGTNGASATGMAGSITVDGQGNVTGGIEDIAGNAGSPFVVTGGSYHIGTDGRGSLTLQTTAGTTKWQMVMAGHARVYLTSFDGTSNVSSGAMDLETPAQLNSTSIQGGYSFLVTGASAAHPSGTLQVAGAFTADGVGSISQGLLDVNDSGATQPSLAASGTFTGPTQAGRGSLTLTTSSGTKTFVYYLVDGTRLKLLENDTNGISTGEAVKQTGSSFANATFNLTLVTALFGSDSHGPVSLGGVVTLNGLGAVKATIDTNNNGNVATGQSVNGSYTVTDSTTGRTTVTWTASDGTHQFVFYPAQNNDLNLIEMDTASAAGPALSQRLSGFSNASISGKFATRSSGTDFAGNAGAAAFSGQLIPNGGSAIAGVLDINNNGTLAAATATSGSYSFDPTGRATATLSTGSSSFATALLGMYAADTNRAVYIELDSNRVITGVMQKQY